MYQALYRKWRPQTFDQVIGQKHITDTLKNQVENGRLSHAYIFIGTRGTGKTTCARILAKAVNCEHPVNGNPCGECPSCRGIDNGEILDVVEMDAASNTGVDNVRALREEAVFSPAAVKKRVYIIDEVHMLSMSSFNALLKILEEPPEHLMFILATTEVQKVPATVLSRCQRHQFRRIDSEVIADYLQDIAAKEGFGLTKDASELISRLADGGVRDALSLLDQCSGGENIDIDSVYNTLGLAGNRQIVQMLEYILAHDTASAISAFSKLWMEGKNPVSFLGELSGLLRDVLMISTAPKGGAELISGSYDIKTLKSFADRMNSKELICSLETLRRVSDDMRDALSARTMAELCLVSLCDDTLGEDLRSLSLRVSRLEERLSKAPPQAMPDESEIAMRELEEDYARRAAREAYDSEEDNIDPSEFAEPQPEDSLPKRIIEAATDTRPDDATAAPTGETKPEEAPAMSAVETKPEETPTVPAANKPTESESAPTPVAAAVENPLTRGEPQEADAGDMWAKICESAIPLLPMEMRLSLGDQNRIRGKLNGSVLRIEVLSGFLYNRFNRSEIIQIFSDAAGKLCGHGVNVTVGELKETAKPLRDINELKNFPEISFK